VVLVGAVRIVNRILNCLTTEHDWRLVLLAVVVCFLASTVAVSLFHRAQVAKGRARAIWLTLDATAAGFGIWSTHFIAMLAFDPGLGAGYNAPLTIVSLLIAILITGIGLAVTLHAADKTFGPIAGGAIVGVGVATMHYTGMMALEVPARLVWFPVLVIASILLGIIWAVLAFHVACRSLMKGRFFVATSLLTIAIVSMHFTAMSAVDLLPDPTSVSNPLSFSPTALSLVVTAAAVIVLGLCLVAALGERRTADKVAQQKALLDTALGSMSQGLCMFDDDGRIILFNERYVDLTGLAPAALTGGTLVDVVKNRNTVGNVEEYVAEIRAAMRQGKTNTHILETNNGRMLRIVESARQDGGWVSTLEDITDWHKAQMQIEHMARHDALTNLPNRRLFRERLEATLQGIKRAGQIAVLCIDLDHFKDVNDTLGHPVGDELLKEISGRLKRCVRDGDIVARLGGDEFAIVQVGADLKLGDTATLATRLIEVASAPCTICGHDVLIGASIGISVAPNDGYDADQLLKNSDIALYRAKSEGRGNYRFFEAGMDARALARRTLELELRAAVAREEFQLEYQPLFDIKTNAIICFEALLRWKHPYRGTIEPSHFIPLAEETGLIIPIGDWVIRKACADAARWPQDIRIAINISPAQFKSRSLVNTLKDALSSSGLAPNRLELEITETVLLQGGDALTTLHLLRSLGMRISMDDFGTGYSSLSYLRSFPFDKIKIDRSFISELGVGGESMAIVRAVTGLGKSLGISTTAEGVETSEQLSLLRSEGCDEVQGYFFSPALPASEVEKLLLKPRLRVMA
jgi:diguanylate cyclase (GGDEF)-like protein/PAS domain S-box-containing protein